MIVHKSQCVPRISLKSAIVSNREFVLKAVRNFKPAAATSTLGAKKPYVPYKSPAKPGLGARPGLGGPGKRAPVKMGGGKMGGKFF